MAFQIVNNQWVLTAGANSLPLAEVARRHARPFYLYDLDDALKRVDTFLRSGWPIHYAMKANSFPPLLRELARRGVGVDVVSLGELQKAMACGFPPQRVIFSGVAKDREELEAAIDHRLFQINVESFEELQLLNEICVGKRVTADIALRLNIELVAPTHEHVQTATPDSKFGMDLAQMNEVFAWLSTKKHLRVRGIATHIGSQIEDVEIFARMTRKMGELFHAFRAQGLPLERLDLGGGLGIDYHSAGTNDLAKAEIYLQRLRESHGTDAQILLEPGRFLVARMGVLLAKAIYVKKTSAQKFLILNAGMNCLLRPALYGAFHRISPLVQRPLTERYTVVGPICESTDKFAVNREMAHVEPNDWVGIFDAGAYGATMANHYNESPLPEQWSFLNGTWEVS